MTNQKEKYHKCYYSSFSSEIAQDYQQQVRQKHPSRPVYPSSKYLVKNSLKKQDKYWEYLGIDN
jgi:hypothetical protein